MGLQCRQGPDGPDLDNHARGTVTVEEQVGGAAKQLRTVAGMLRHWAMTTPGAPMLTAGDVTLTWDELYGRAEAGEPRAQRRRRRTG